MNIDNFGIIELTSSDGFDLLYKDQLNIQNYFFDAETTDKFNQSININKDTFEKLKKYSKSTLNIKEFDKQNQQQWFMPKNYFENLIEYIYNKCNNQTQINRVNLELELYIKYNMLNLLFYLKYLVDTMREHNIVWGVGRGSSVSSYVLYLIGVHKIDSLRYNLDINEFFK